MTGATLRNALIGHTGFVGGQLLRQTDFEALFNSKNIADINNHEFEYVICAAAPGSMFEANKFPDADKARIDQLISDISGVKTKTFILISTIAVLENFSAPDETTAAFDSTVAYGRNRRTLEAFCAAHFARCLVVRLPALFGAGIKKNFLFDILNPMPSMLPRPRLAELADRMPQALRDGLQRLYAWNETLGMLVIDRDALEASGQRAAYDAAVKEAGFAAELFTARGSRFQYYDMTRLWHDICLSLDAGLAVIHFAPPPLAAGQVYAQLTGSEMPAGAARVHTEDMRTRHAGLWGAEGPYFETEAEVIARLRRFFASERGSA